MTKDEVMVQCSCCGMWLYHQWAVWMGIAPDGDGEYMCQRCADEECDCWEEF